MATTHIVERHDAVKALERSLRAALTIAHLQKIPVTTAEGPFRIDRMLGRGASGVVCEAFDHHMDRRVALKLYPGIADANLAKSVRNEAQRLGRLSHRNIVTVYNYQADVLKPANIKSFYVAMELLSGVSLRHWLAGRPSPEAIIDVFCRAGDGLAAAHAADLVHRDFKPENVMLVDRNEPKIVDFGLAIDKPIATAFLPNRTSNERMIVGTLAYMAPEALEGKANARSDQFAFAAALWEALYEEFPYPIESVDPARCRVLKRPQRADEFPDELLRCLSQALRGDPRRRFSTMDDFVERLRDLQPRVSEYVAARAAASAISVDAMTVEIERPPASPRRPMRLAAASVGLLGITGLVTLGALRAWSTPDSDERVEGASEASGPAPVVEHAGAMTESSPPALAVGAAESASPGCDDSERWLGTWALTSTALWDQVPKSVGIHGQYQLVVERGTPQCSFEVTVHKRAVKTKTETTRIDHSAKTTGRVQRFGGRQLLVLTGVAPHERGKPGLFSYDFALERSGDTLVGDFHGVRTDGERSFSGSLVGARGVRETARARDCDRALQKQISGRWAVEAENKRGEQSAHQTFHLRLSAQGCDIRVTDAYTPGKRLGSGVLYGDGLWRIWLDGHGLRRDLTFQAHGVDVHAGTFRTLKGAPGQLVASGPIRARRP